MAQFSIKIKTFLLSALFLIITILILGIDSEIELVLVLLFFLIQLIIITKIFSPLQKLSNILSKFNPKDGIDINSLEESDDEVGSIQKALISISMQSKEYTKNLASLNSQLEEKVRQRTQELVDKNEHLQQEIISRKQKEQMLIQQSKMAAMGEMISAISHQWRQPLNMLSLQLQDVYFKFNLGKLSHDDMENANEKANSLIQFMSQTIDDFRNFFSPEKEHKPFDVRVAINETLFLVQSILKNNNINVNIKGGGVKALGLQNEFKQVLLNLFNNSKDAIVEHYQKDAPNKGNIDIDIKENNEYYCVHFTDTGGGIPEHLLDQIYEPYFTTKSSDEGTGIGLYMSKMIIEQNMNGKIDVNILENGTEFVLRLPKIK